MYNQDLSDLYTVKRTPWLLAAAGVILALVVAFLIFGGRDEKDRSKEETDVVEAADSADGYDAAESAQPVVDEPAADTEATSEKLSRPAVVPPMPAEEVKKAFNEAENLENSGQLESAVKKYTDILERASNLGEAEIKRLEDKIGKLNVELLTTPRLTSGKTEYVIEYGDSLSAIASKYNCPVDLIMKSNNISDPLRIRPGNRLVFPDHPEFSIEVSKGANTLVLKLGGRFFKRYTVGTGAYGKTPVGTYRVSDKVKEPAWWPGDGRNAIPYGDPENILGTRWLALEATGETPRVSGYGIHGTWDDSSLGKQSSAGCVRMNNGDVEELFMFVPRGVSVRITE